MTPEIDQKNLAAFFYRALRAPTALVIGVHLSRMPNIFAKNEHLSLDFSTNTMLNRINSFYFHAIKRIMQ